MRVARQLTEMSLRSLYYAGISRNKWYHLVSMKHPIEKDSFRQSPRDCHAKTNLWIVE